MAHTDKEAKERSGRDSGNTGNRGNLQGSEQQAGNRQSHAGEGESFVLVDSEQGLDIGDDLYAIGEVRRADRLPHRQGGDAGQSRQSTGSAPDTTGSTGV